MLRQDTIAAFITPWGVSGIGVIRISGPESLAIARRLFRPLSGNCLWKSHHLYYGDIMTADGKTILDEVLISFMPKPNSFTGEDVVEIHCHGNPIILQAVFAQLQACGCRPARPGEFSERAFLNQRIDLSQAEALATMISAKSARACAIGLMHLKGSLSKKIEEIRSLLIEVLAILEADIDFTEDTANEKNTDVSLQINTLQKNISELLDSYKEGRAYSEGIHVVITGRPNVGKSSLLNALTGREKAIVTDIPGTTRDLITDTIHIGGIPINLIDTAGIREPQNIIEKEGVQRAWDKITQADVIIIMLDGSKPLTQDDRMLLDKIRTGNIVVAVNKIDRPPSWQINAIAHLLSNAEKIVKISARFGHGLENLKKTVVDFYKTEDKTDNDAVIINLRHKLALEKTLNSIQTAKGSLERGMSAEFAIFDLREALDHLDEITGKRISDEILDKIFSSFCIGK